MMKIVNAMLKDLRCYYGLASGPDFRGLCMVLPGDNLQFLLVISSGYLLEDENGNRQQISVRFLDEVPFVSIIWNHVVLLRMKNQPIRGATLHSRSLRGQLGEHTLGPLTPTQIGIQHRRSL